MNLFESLCKYFEIPKKVGSMVCMCFKCLNVIRTQYSRHVVIICCITSMPLTTPLQWPQGIVKCPVSIVPQDIAGSNRSSTFHLQFYEYIDFGHILLEKYGFSDGDLVHKNLPRPPKLDLLKEEP